MAKEMPSQEYLQECFNYDPSTGVLVWKYRPIQHFKDGHCAKAWNNKMAGKQVGVHRPDAGLSVTVNYKQMLVHRVIWKLCNGAEPGLIDHKDGVRGNNKLDNLREALPIQNSQNCKLRKTSTTGLKGIKFDPRGKGTWSARIGTRLGRLHLGSFATAELAHKAYCEAAKLHHGEFANNGT